MSNVEFEIWALGCQSCGLNMLVQIPLWKMSVCGGVCCFVLLLVFCSCFGCLVRGHGLRMLDGLIVGLLLLLTCPVQSPSVQALFVLLCCVFHVFCFEQT